MTNLGGLVDQLAPTADPFAWEPNLYDWRHSRVQVDKRMDAGEVVEICSEIVPLVGACGAELDVRPVPHHPRCPRISTAARIWDRDSILAALREASPDGVHAPGRLEWMNRDPEQRRPTHQIVAAEFGNWTAAVKEAGLKTQPRGKPMKGRRRLPPREEGEDDGPDVP